MKTYTKNPLSLEPGGVTLIIEYQNGAKERHTNVKFPNAYKNKVLAVAEKPIKCIYTERDREYYYQTEDQSLPF